MVSQRARSAAVAADRPSASRLGMPPPGQHSLMRGFPGCVARVRAHIRARRQHQQSGDRGNPGPFHAITSSARSSRGAAGRGRAPPRIDHKPVSGRRLHRQVPGLLALEDRRHLGSSASATIRLRRPAQARPRHSSLMKDVDAPPRVARSQCGKSAPSHAGCRHARSDQTDYDEAACNSRRSRRNTSTR
jgi:hypothetical protein